MTDSLVVCHLLAGRTKFLQLRLEVTGNLNDPDSQRHLQAPQPGPEVANGPNDL